jgi:hypothetical protein
MAVRTRVEPIAETINLWLDQTLSPRAQSQAFANFARAKIDAGDEANRRVLGRIPPRTVTVDGSRGASLEAVRPQGGSIIAEWELISDVLVWIGEALRDRSPHVSGDYQRAHTLFADGVEIPIGGQAPIAEEYVFLNPLPYARKIEIGKTRSGRDFVLQVPNRIYERTAADAASRFGNLAKIKFTYRAPFDRRLLAYVPARASNRPAAAHEKSLRVPAIVVTLKAA